MSAGGANPLTSPASFRLAPASTRYLSPSTLLCSRVSTSGEGRCCSSSRATSHAVWRQPARLSTTGRTAATNSASPVDTMGRLCITDSRVPHSDCLRPTSGQNGPYRRLEVRLAVFFAFRPELVRLVVPHAARLGQLLRERSACCPHAYELPPGPLSP